MFVIVPGDSNVTRKVARARSKAKRKDLVNVVREDIILPDKIGLSKIKQEE